jgi:hypothetical protein
MLLASPRIAPAAASLDAYEALTQTSSAVTVDIAFGLKSGITCMSHVIIVMYPGDMNAKREVFVPLLASLGGLAIPTMVLATAPGGIAEMCITAKVLRLGVPLVTAAHVTRVLMLVTTTAPLYRLVLRLRARRA